MTTDEQRAIIRAWVDAGSPMDARTGEVILPDERRPKSLPAWMRPGVDVEWSERHGHRGWGTIESFSHDGVNVLVRSYCGKPRKMLCSSWWPFGFAARDLRPVQERPAP